MCGGKVKAQPHMTDMRKTSEPSGDNLYSYPFHRSWVRHALNLRFPKCAMKTYGGVET
jgi:hypothetical protein